MIALELQQLKYFKAVADIGKISEAAEKLFVSAPALSTSISRLEKELGTKLFDRTNNRILLNKQGQILQKHVNQIFDTLESAKQELQQSILRQGPHISVASVNTAMWVNLITAFMSEFPQYALSWSSISLPELAQGGISPHHSFLLAYDSDIPPSYEDKLCSTFLFQAHIMVELHKEHPLAEKDIIDIPMLANEKLFMPVPGYSLYRRLNQLFSHYGLPFPAEASYSFLPRQKMVSENTGISFITSCVTQTVPSPNIRYIPLLDPFGPWNAYLYWRKEHSLTEDEMAFRDFVKAFFRDLH